jgi:hypothetical protein
VLIERPRERSEATEGTLDTTLEAAALLAVTL